MHRDRPQEAGFSAERRHARKEWEANSAEQHQLEAREHARQDGKLRPAHGPHKAEADVQSRELRAHY